MKTLPIIHLGNFDKQNYMLREYIRREEKRLNKVVFISTPEKKQEALELISEEENKKILDKLKQISKEIFGI